MKTDIDELLKQIKEITGIDTFEHYITGNDHEFEIWVSRPDEIGEYLMVDKLGNISTYAKISPGNDRFYACVPTIKDFKLDYQSLRTIIMIENRPELVKNRQISTSTELLDWLMDNDYLLSLDKNEAEAVMSTFLEDGSTLYHDDLGSLYVKREDSAHKTNIDNIIDMAAQKNFKELWSLKEELYHISEDKNLHRKVEDFSSHLDKFSKFMQLEMTNRHLISAYSKTIYGKRYHFDYQYSNTENHKPIKRGR